MKVIVAKRNEFRIYCQIIKHRCPNSIVAKHLPVAINDVVLDKCTGRISGINPYRMAVDRVGIYRCSSAAVTNAYAIPGGNCWLLVVVIDNVVIYGLILTGRANDHPACALLRTWGLSIIVNDVVP